MRKMVRRILSCQTSRLSGSRGRGRFSSCTPPSSLLSALGFSDPEMSRFAGDFGLCFIWISVLLFFCSCCSFMPNCESGFEISPGGSLNPGIGVCAGDGSWELDDDCCAPGDEPFAGEDILLPPNFARRFARILSASDIAESAITR